MILAQARLPNACACDQQDRRYYTHEKTLNALRHAKLPTGATHSEQADAGIDRFGHFAGLTASVPLGQPSERY
jgi:hypothetical protein